MLWTNTREAGLEALIFTAFILSGLISKPPLGPVKEETNPFFDNVPRIFAVKASGVSVFFEISPKVTLFPSMD